MRWLIALAVLTGVLLSLQYACGRFLNEFQNAGVFDWPFFMEAARNFISRGNIYDPNVANFYPSAPIYKFPPFLVSVVVFLAENGISEEKIRHGFAVLHIVLYVACALMLGWSCARKIKWLFLALIIIFVSTFESFVVNFYRLQPEILVLFLLITTAMLAIKEKRILAGMCIGFAAAIKIYPIIFAAYFLFENRSRYFVGVLIGIFGSLLFSLAIVGYSEHWRYWVEILPVLLREDVYLSVENVSLAAVLMRFSLSQTSAVFFANGILCLGMLVLAGGYFRSGKNLWKQSDMTWLAFSVLVSTFVLGTKNAWWNYQLLLMLPMIAVAGVNLNQEKRDIPSIIMILFSCLLIFFMNAGRLAPIIDVSYEPVIPGFLATLLVALASIRLYWRVSGMRG